MIRLWESHRSAVRTCILLGITSIAAAACNKGTAGADTATAVPAASSSASAPSTGVVPLTNVSGKHGTFVVDTADIDDPPTGTALAGALPLNSIDNYKTDGAAFWKFVHSRSWLGWERTRKCKPSADCAALPGGAGKAQVLVQAIEDAHEVGPADISVGTDVLIARVTNYGPSAEPALLDCAPPNIDGKDQCYIILHRETANGGTQLRYVHMVAADTPTPTLDFKQSGSYYVRCVNHPKKKRHYAIGDFAGCNDPPPDPLTKDPPSALGPVWLSCAEGCCSAEYPFLSANKASAKAKAK